MNTIANLSQLMNVISKKNTDIYKINLIKSIEIISVHYDLKKGIAILSQNRSKANTPQANSNLYKECNGVVIDLNTCKIISISPYSIPVSNLNLDKSLDSLKDKQIKITPLHDGTILTIYKWKDMWHLSSNTGYMLNCCWMGNVDYHTAIFTILQNKYPETIKKYNITLENQNLDFGSLDSNYCYTIGIKFSQYHPYKSNGDYIWQIQQVNLSKPFSFTNFNGIFGIPEIILNEEDLNNLTKPVWNNGLSNFGIITEDVNGNKTIIESELMNKIKKIMYEKEPKEYFGKIKNDERLKYNLIRSLLSRNLCKNVPLLFPEFSSDIQKINDIKDNIINQILYKFRQYTPEKEKEINTPLLKLIKKLYDHINKYDTKISSTVNLESIIRDFIQNPNLALLLLPLI